MNALLLGQRQDISDELTANYSKAGAVHILAISGLHVGIILVLLSFVLKPLERVKRGKLIKLVLIISFLWFFAVLAGMSASVTRAVTMFSALALGQFFNKKNAVEQSLVFSMFIIVLWKPIFLFDIGFQLSYLAVFGIIWIQPLVYNAWTPKLYIAAKGWQLFTVSLAAQIGVLPLSLFYFHQFPGLFFVSNLLIIPFLGVILGIGIIVVVLSYYSVLPAFMVTIYGGVISVLNKTVVFIARQETFLFSDISFSAIKMFFLYLLIIAYFQFILKKCSALMQSIVRHPKPVIAQVDGVATAAGCQLALSCDVVYASTSSRFATPGVNIGLFCSTPMVALSRNASAKHSMEMLLTGDFISADEAADKGLINKSIEQANLEPYVLEKANKIASKSKTTLKIGKEAFYAQIEMPLSNAYEYASQVMVENMLDQDANEGMDAFLDKRPPSWKS